VSVQEDRFAVLPAGPHGIPKGVKGTRHPVKLEGTFSTLAHTNGLDYQCNCCPSVRADSYYTGNRV
jgi:hypothetical protein